MVSLVLFVYFGVWDWQNALGGKGREGKVGGQKRAGQKTSEAENVRGRKRHMQKASEAENAYTKTLPIR